MKVMKWLRDLYAFVYSVGEEKLSKILEAGKERLNSYTYITEKLEAVLCQF